jgi:hypothetical protein
MDLCMVRDERRLALVPATDLDRDRLTRLPKSAPMEVMARFNRTSSLNRWYRGLVGHVADAIGVNPDALHADLKFKARLIERIFTCDGTIAVQLRSTAFPVMQDGEFDTYCTVATDIMFREHLPHVRERQRQKLIMEWVGRRPKLEAPPGLLSHI